MDIQSLGILNNTMFQGNVTTVKNTESDFKELFEKITGGKLAREIRENYNVTLNVGNVINCDEFLNTNDLRGTNHVIISPAALSKMENNPVLKEKVLNDIEEFCSPENQAEIKALQPPVKSAGMIVYPDGRTLYWIEGYPNEIGSEKNKIITNEKSINELLQMYGNADNQIAELEDKYCSLCGSMIKEDGSCPLCGVPTFISGNGRSGNQKIVQAASSHMVLKSTTGRMK